MKNNGRYGMQSIYDALLKSGQTCPMEHIKHSIVAYNYFPSTIY